MLLFNSLILPVFGIGATSEDLSVPIGDSVQSSNFFGYTCIKQLIFNLATAALTIAGIITFIFLVWGGIEWITGGGDKQKTESAKNRITQALVGLTIIACSWALYQLILFFFGIDISNVCSEKFLN
jgi:hypothetical protein